MGATLAFEIAVRLEADGIRPLALFTSGRRAPSCHRDERVHQRDDKGLLDEMHRLNGTSTHLLLDDDVLQMILPAIRADYKAAETYRYRDVPPLSTPIYAHIGIDDPKVTVDEASAWSAHTTGHFELQTHPGDHFYLNTRSAELVAAIEQVLESTASSSRGQATG
jgi:surfactin synthase thioesterase subunit